MLIRQMMRVFDSVANFDSLLLFGSFKRNIDLSLRMHDLSIGRHIIKSRGHTPNIQQFTGRDTKRILMITMSVTRETKDRVKRQPRAHREHRSTAPEQYRALCPHSAPPMPRKKTGMSTAAKRTL